MLEKKTESLIVRGIAGEGAAYLKRGQAVAGKTEQSARGKITKTAGWILEKVSKAHF